MVHRFIRTKNLMEMGYRLETPDCFTADCFGIIQEELQNQRRLKEKHGKVNR